MLEEVPTCWVHSNHNTSQPCFDNCPKVDLETFIVSKNLKIEDRGLRYTSSYVSSAGIKVSSLVEKLIKCPSNPLFSENYCFELLFNELGEAHIEAAVWPQWIDQYNKEQGLYSYNGIFNEDVETHFIEQLDFSLSTSSCRSVIKETFDLSEASADALVLKVKEHQIHYGDDCSSCKKPPLPSLNTMLKKTPDNAFHQNIKNSKHLLFLVRDCMTLLSEEEVSSLKTHEFLDKLNDDHVEFCSNYQEETEAVPSVGIVFKSLHRLHFLLDKRLSELIVKYQDTFTGLYHYALSCASNENGHGVILARRSIIDCYTNAYCEVLLRATSSPVRIEVLCGMDSWRAVSGGNKASYIPLEGLGIVY